MSIHLYNGGMDKNKKISRNFYIRVSQLKSIMQEKKRRDVSASVVVRDALTMYFGAKNEKVKELADA